MSNSNTAMAEAVVSWIQLEHGSVLGITLNPPIKPLGCPFCLIIKTAPPAPFKLDSWVAPSEK